jgi:hypothetical protein
MAIECPILTPDGKLYQPLPAQAAFHGSSARCRSLIGAFGSGKTLPGAVEGLIQSLEVPKGEGGMGLIARYDWHELLHSTWKTFIDIIPPPIKRQCQITKTPPMVIFPNGFTVIGFNLKNHQKMQSMNLSWAWIDEVNEDGVDESTYLQLVGRLRNQVGRRHLWLTGNPAGRNWVYDRFFKWKFDATAKRYKSHEGFQSRTLDNTHLPEDYIEGMYDTYPDDWMEKYNEGSFDVFEGQILDLRPELHLIDNSDLRQIPAEWPRYRAVDHGLTAPTACLWTASDFEGNFVSYRNYYQRCPIPEENAKAILLLSAAEEELIQWTVIDPATEGANVAGGVAEKLIDQYRRGGLPCIKGDNDVKASIAKMQMLLAPDPSHAFPAWHPRAGEMGSPRWFIFKDLRELIWEMQQWKWTALRPGSKHREKPFEKDDHLIACARYFFMRSPQAAQPVREITTAERFERMINDLFPDKGSDEGLIGLDRLTK